MNNFYRVLIFINILPFSILAQDSSNVSTQYLYLKTQYFQIKEAANYGLVFNGANLLFGYKTMKQSTQNIYSFEADLGAGTGYNKGVSVNIHLKPVDIFYGWSLLDNNTSQLYLGPYLSTNYYYQFYPELQSGHSFWFTFIDTGPKLVYKMPLKKLKFRISFSASFLGLVSRPVLPPTGETHFYSLKFSDIVKNAHSNFEFGSSTLMNHTNLEIELLDVTQGGLTLAYEFEYFGYYEAPKLDYLSHSINIRWRI